MSIFYGAIQTPPFNQENTFSVLPLVEIFIIKYSPKKHIKMLRAFAVEYGSKKWSPGGRTISREEIPRGLPRMRTTPLLLSPEP